MNGACNHDLVGRLVDVLHLHVRRHRGLLALLERKKKASGSLKDAELEQLLDAEQEAILAIGATETERLQICGLINAAWGRPPETSLRLVELVQHAGEDHREELLDLREELRDLADELEMLNCVQRSIAVHSLDHIHLCVALPAKDQKDFQEVEHARPHP